ncbi:thiol reductant ABC exporter subunit CydC [Desulforamulus ferrireducens]|uniref:Thiol reductant ABC exporter subunit CydC n=1 Tax=Desulforamulus ferrireducens TaxID=1833852 RepID=A0A1S6IW15_9FIRM|nr:thiol reductant ABC exporter subunit CydC [Desulforamulus ferrireducens]AQS58977.1 thiol reductant ABC exporter subunit CydC [Desulforamulus ferrireducens]
MKVFFRLVKLVAPQWQRMLWAILLGCLTVGSNVGLLITSAYLISKAALHPSVAELMVAIVGVRFFGIARAVFRYLERYFSHDVTFRLLSRLRVWFYQALEPLAPASLQNYRSGDLLSRIVADVEVLKNFYLRVLAPPLVAVLILMLMLIFYGQFDHSLAYVYLFFFVLAGVLLPLGVRQLGAGRGRQLVAARAEINTKLVDSIQGMTEIIAYGQRQAVEESIKQSNERLIKLQGQTAGLSALTNSLSSLFMHLALWFMLVLSIPLVTAGQINGVYLAVLALGVLSSFEAVGALPMTFHYLEESLAAGKRLFHITSNRPTVSTRETTKVTPPNFGLRFEGLSFSYDGHTYALRDINFTIPQGGRVAVVGPSGAGKSTLVNLLLRFWDYEQGAIYLGEQNIKELSTQSMSDLVAVVSQRTHLFNATIRENLLLAKPTASEEEMAAVIRRARLEDFIRELPDGYQTYIGEGGFKLSGGQRQRLAIARALLKDAPILILDEATSGLDAVTEQEVLTAIFDLMQGRTCLMITHRLTGLEKMDQILVLSAGRLVEQGSHQELLRNQGLFYEMWQLSRQTIANL